jgi:hypothetical protein
MSKVTTGATMSLDGFIADANHGGFDYLFKWYAAGDVEVPTGNPDLTPKVSAASAEHLRRLNDRLGALVVGRRLYDMTNAWGGRHPLDLTTVVATHQRPATGRRTTKTSSSSPPASRTRWPKPGRSPVTRTSAPTGPRSPASASTSAKGLSSPARPATGNRPPPATECHR